MIIFHSLKDIQMFNAEKLCNISGNFTRIPKYGELGLAAKLKPQEYALLCILYEYLNTDDGRCYPSQDALLDRLRVGKRSLQSYLQSLENEGFIRRIRTYKTTRNGKLAYTTTEILIVPPEYITRREYHDAINKFIEENRFVIVNYDKKGRRNEVGTGKRKDVSRQSSNTAGYVPDQKEHISSEKLTAVLSYQCSTVIEEKPIEVKTLDDIVIEPSAQNGGMAHNISPKVDPPIVSEEELQKAREEFQVLREIPKLSSNTDFDKEIESMLTFTKRQGYKPGYDTYARKKIEELTANPYYAERPESILLTIKTDYITLWNRLY